VMELHWSPAGHNGAPVELYILQMAVDKAAWKEVWRGRECTATMPGAGAGATQLFRVQARNREGCSTYSSVAKASSAAEVPAPPQGLSLMSAPGTTLKIKWNKADGRGSVVLGHVVEVCLPSSAVRWEVETAVSPLSYKAARLTIATEYEIRVAATNIVGRGEWSEALRVSTTAEAPPPPKVQESPILSTENENEVDQEEQQMHEQTSTTKRTKKKTRGGAGEVIKQKQEEERALKEYKRQKYEASWKYKASKVLEFASENPMVISSIFVGILVLIMMFVGIDEEGPSGPLF